MRDPQSVIIVPFRDKGDASRRRNLAKVLDHLHATQIGPVWVSSDGQDGPFNRSKAYNRGVAKHSKADVFVFCEADLLVPKTQLVEAVKLAVAERGLVVPFDTFCYLGKGASIEVCDGGRNPFRTVPERVMADGRSVGAVNIVSAHTMRSVGQWDETFSGWGYDDRAMVRAFEVATDTPTRFVEGKAVHLWHTPGWQAGQKFAGGAATVPQREQVATKANERRYKRYLRAGTAAAVRELTAGAR